ncbi:MAG TPA: polysaccharide deacetylase family protein [Solirubrobacterales bacterium]
MAAWPGGTRGALCLSFDNLGVDEASSATGPLPALLEKLDEHGLAATFFCEGVNAELNPDALQSIAAAGHEVAYHAWRHEQWGDLTAVVQIENLARGVDAFRELGIALAGLRPPGGQLGDGGVEVLREAGLRYASPAGAGAGTEGGIALLPFQWRHVDATSMLPGLDPVREQMTGAPDPLDPDTFVAYVEGEVGDIERGGFMSIVLHLPLLDWLGEDRLTALLGRLRVARESGVWVPTYDAAAGRVLADPKEFERATKLDPTTWAA